MVAANSVTRGSDEQVAYALAIVTALGTIAMFAMPAAAPLLGLDLAQTGIWLGASIHEVAQVVGAAAIVDDHAVGVATVAKMVRVMSLAPLVLGMAAVARRRAQTEVARRRAQTEGTRRRAQTEGTRRRAQTETGTSVRVPMPWFVFGFLALAGLASLDLVPVPVMRDARLAAAFMLAAALGAMGFGIDLAALRRMGLRPLLLAVSSWMILAGVSLGLVELLA